MSKQFVSYPVTIGKYNFTKTIRLEDYMTEYDYTSGDIYNPIYYIKLFEMTNKPNLISANFSSHGCVYKIPNTWSPIIEAELGMDLLTFIVEYYYLIKYYCEDNDSDLKYCKVHELESLIKEIKK